MSLHCATVTGLNKLILLKVIQMSKCWNNKFNINQLPGSNTVVSRQKICLISIIYSFIAETEIEGLLSPVKQQTAFFFNQAFQDKIHFHVQFLPSALSASWVERVLGWKKDDYSLWWFSLYPGSWPQTL